MGKYTVRRPNGTIERVDISRQISNGFKYSKTIDYNYFPTLNGQIDIEKFSPLNDPDGYWSHPLKDPDENPSFNENAIRNSQTLSRELIRLTVHLDSKMCTFSTFNGSSISAAEELFLRYDLPTCILNFTSLSKPLIDFLNGTDSQEDFLLRQTSLYVTLKGSPMYHEARKCTDTIYTDTMVYSSKIPAFRSSSDETLLKKSSVFQVSVITAIAPDLNHGDYEKDPSSNIVYIYPVKAKEALLTRARRMIMVAIENQNKALVIQMDGNTNTTVWREVFETLLIKEGLGKFFQKVVYAIYCSL